MKFRRQGRDTPRPTPAEPPGLNVANHASIRQQGDTTTLDLGSAYRIDSVRLPSRTGATRPRVRVQASNFGRDWHDIAEVQITAGEDVALEPETKVWARHLRIVGVDPADPPAEVLTAPAAAQRARPTKLVVACRHDGLGERLNEMVAARRLATLIGADFAFAWDDTLADDEGHAIRPVEHMFTPDFIEQCHVDVGNLRIKRFKKSVRTRTELDRILLGVQAVRCPYEGLEGLELGDVDSSQDAGNEFTSFRFADDLDAAIRAAHDVELPPASAALHLRGGDVIMGYWRHVGQYSHKAVSIPVARAMIHHLEREGRSVVMFGQEADVMAELRSTSSAVRWTDITDTRFDDRVAQALFDLVGLSRFELIVGGTSGYARQASSMGGHPHLTADDLLSDAQQLEACLTDDRLSQGAYHPRQAALAWWSAYRLGRDAMDADDALTLLRNAAAADPDASLYPLVAAAFLYDGGRVSEADQVIAERLVSEVAAPPEMPLLDLVTTRRPDWSVISRALTSIRSAADHSAVARLVATTTKVIDLDISGAVADLRRDEPELSTGPLSGLDIDVVELVLSLTPRIHSGLVDESEHQALTEAIRQWRDDH